ncbi:MULTISPECIES: hypothetical protein [unclassified Schaalia]|uniref:hypothetical protein n=1 Tax=unclassified Schaalia TaxID=2691889 RepID=UPI001E3B1367|nr:MULTISPECIES: hypothetical protein [unclassified Schaalia]MCD4549203.1 hypothetical protein [Schaalia sp. lx-260]MCD4556957.1 hypothetical protein [Schaalia sp. lx-100]
MVLTDEEFSKILEIIHYDPDRKDTFLPLYVKLRPYSLKNPQGHRDIEDADSMLIPDELLEEYRLLCIENNGTETYTYEAYLDAQALQDELKAEDKHATL